MSSLQRLSKLLELHLKNNENPSWALGESKIQGRGIFATRDIKRGEIILRDSPLLIGPSARQEDMLNTCSLCFKELPESKFMCRQGCSLPVCGKCSKKIEHKQDCDLFKSWQPIEADVANSVVIRLLCIARAIHLCDEKRNLVTCLEATLDNNHRAEVRNAAKYFKNFPTDKKIVDIMCRSVAAVRTYGLDETNDRTNDNQEFLHRALFPLFAMMNHQCIPNSFYTFDKITNDMIIRASIDIESGAEITTTYAKIFSGNIARYSFLKTKKKFICKCSRCTDPTERDSFLSALYCRDVKCSGVAVPGTEGLPHPDWLCTVCKQKSTHGQIIKSQDIAVDAINSKLYTNSLKTVVEYIDEKVSNLVPLTNHVVVDTKLTIIRRLEKEKEDCDEKHLALKVKFCQDLLDIMDKLGFGDCLMRQYLEVQKKI